VKIKEFERFAREYLLPDLPGFELKKGILFSSPIGYVLRAFTHQPSAFDRNPFYIHAFLQPLFVPAEYETGVIGIRSRAWRLDRDRVSEIQEWAREEGRPLLEKAHTPGELADRIREHDQGHLPDPHKLEALAYSLVLAGEYEAAYRKLDDAVAVSLDYISEDAELWADSDEEDWLHEVLARMRRVREALKSDPTAAVAILHEWRRETARNLGVEDYLSPEPAKLAE
jgi:hypothetical protein